MTFPMQPVPAGNRLMALPFPWCCSGGSHRGRLDTGSKTRVTHCDLAVPSECTLPALRRAQRDPFITPGQAIQNKHSLSLSTHEVCSARAFKLHLWCTPGDFHCTHGPNPPLHLLPSPWPGGPPEPPGEISSGGITLGTSLASSTNRGRGENIKVSEQELDQGPTTELSSRAR